MSNRNEFAKQLTQRGLLWSYDSTEVEKLPDSVLIEHDLVYGDVPDIETIFKIFPTEAIQSTWEKVLLPNPNHRKIKKPYSILNQVYETLLNRLQRLAAENS